MISLYKHLLTNAGLQINHNIKKMSVGVLADLCTRSLANAGLEHITISSKLFKFALIIQQMQL